MGEPNLRRSRLHIAKQHLSQLSYTATVNHDQRTHTQTTLQRDNRLHLIITKIATGLPVNHWCLLTVCIADTLINIVA